MPLDIRIKQYMREFVLDRIDYEKKRHGILRGSGGMILREVDAEKYIDDLWVYVNKKLLEQQQQDGPAK